jgi:hypothetical protein
LATVARAPMAALAAAERGLFSLLGVIERSNLLPADEIRDVTRTANEVASAMAATAENVVAMEKAAQATPSSRGSLTPTINAFVVQLDHGVRQYNEMVDAAAQLVSTVDSPMSQQRYRDELVEATDRLMGWTQALEELGGPRRLIS